MAAAPVGSGHNTLGGSTTVTVSKTGVTAGNLIVITAALYDAPAIASVVDHLGNSLSSITSITTPDGGSLAAFWYRAPSSGDFVWTATGSGQQTSLVATEIGGVLASGTLLDVFATAVTGTGTALSIGPTAATAQADEIAILFLTAENNASPSWTLGGGYTMADQILNADQSAYLAYKVLSATGAQSATATLSVSTQYAGILATFKAATGGGGGPTVVNDQLLERGLSTGILSGLT